MTETTIAGIRVQFLYAPDGKIIGIIFPDIKPDGFTPAEISLNYGTTEALAYALAAAFIAALP